MLLVKVLMVVATGFWYGPNAAKVRIAVDDGVCKIGRAVVQPRCGQDQAARVVVRVQADDEDKPGKCDGQRCVVVRKQKQCGDGDKTASKEIVCKKVIVAKKGDGPASVVCEPGEAMGWCKIEDLPGCGDKDGSKKVVRMKVICSDEDGGMPSCCKSGCLKKGGHECCGDADASENVVRMKVICSDEDGGMPSDCKSSCSKKNGHKCCGDADASKKAVRMKIRGCGGDDRKPSGCGVIKLGEAFDPDDDILDLRDCPPIGMKDRPNSIWINKRGGGSGCGGGAGPVFVKAGACNDPEDEDGPTDATGFVTVIREGSPDDIAPGGPWLGIQFGPVPRVLAAHLNIDKNSGQMILNVIEDSPADEAGLQQYDVIVTVDGKEAMADVAEFMSIVRKFEPGEKHSFSLIRGGRPMDVSLTVGKRPEKAGACKYETELEELSQADVLHHGGILRKDADGNWKFENLGDLKDMSKLWQHMPDEKGLDRIFKWSGSLPGSRCDFDIETKEGKLQIERCGEKTTVTRTKVEGDKQQVTTKTYDNDEDFKKGDPEAYEMMKKHTCFEFKLGKGPKCMVVPGGVLLESLGKGSEFEVNIRELMENAEEMRKKAGEAGAEARKAYEEAARLHADKSLSGFFSRGKAETSFEVAVDGEIKVTVRKGDEELTQTYASAAALKKARPDLYEKFRTLQGEGKEGKDRIKIQTDD